MFLVYMVYFKVLSLGKSEKQRKVQSELPLMQ